MKEQQLDGEPDNNLLVPTCRGEGDTILGNTCKVMTRADLTELQTDGGDTFRVLLGQK